MNLNLLAESRNGWINKNGFPARENKVFIITRSRSELNIGFNYQLQKIEIGP